MRIHYSREVSAFLRNHGQIFERLRRRVESLLKNPVPEDARVLEDRPGTYEVFESGYWVVYQVDDSGLETVIWVAVIEQT